jgi:predicted ester cyclase
MTPDEAKAAVRRFYDEVWNKGVLAEVDLFLAPGFTLHNGSQPPLVGAVAYKDAVARFRAAIPSLRTRLEDVIAEGDRVVARGVDHFTDDQESRGVPATGRQFATPWVHTFRLEDGQAVEGWLEVDTSGLLADPPDGDEPAPVGA